MPDYSQYIQQWRSRYQSLFGQYGQGRYTRGRGLWGVRTPTIRRPTTPVISRYYPTQAQVVSPARPTLPTEPYWGTGPTGPSGTLQQPVQPPSPAQPLGPIPGQPWYQGPFQAQPGQYAYQWEYHGPTRGDIMLAMRMKMAKAGAFEQYQYRGPEKDEILAANPWLGTDWFSKLSAAPPSSGGYGYTPRNYAPSITPERHTLGLVNWRIGI